MATFTKFCQCVDCGEVFFSIPSFASHLCKNDAFAQADPEGTEDDHKLARADFDRRMAEYHTAARPA